MLNYYKKYTRINKKTISLLRDLILKDKFFKQNPNKKKEMLVFLNIKLSKIYKINTPQLIFVSNFFGLDCYNKITNTIFLSEKLSLVTFLHEFKHALQNLTNRTNNENIARAWSLSLFYQSSPKHFKRAVEKGLIIHLKSC